MASSFRQMTPSERYAYQLEKVEHRVGRRAEEMQQALDRRVRRDPCVGCQVPEHKHDEHGCRQYIPRR